MTAAQTSADNAAAAAKSRPARRSTMLSRLLSDRVAIVAGLFVLLLLFVAVFGRYIYPVDPLAQNLTAILNPPGSAHPFGTDSLGRDLLARMIAGVNVTLLAIATAVAVALAVGLIPGLLAGFIGGWVDVVIMRMADMLVSFPPLLLAIAIVGIIGPGLGNAMIVMGVIMAPTMVRMVRSAVLTVRNEQYIHAAKLMGCSNWRILWRHVLPNIITTVLVIVNLLAANALLAEASLSFIGLGVVPPDASWGSLLQEGAQFIAFAPWQAIIPGLAITLTVLALNLLADGLRRAISGVSSR